MILHILFFCSSCDYYKGKLTTGGLTTNFNVDPNTEQFGNIPIVEMVLNGNIETFDTNFFRAQLSNLLQISSDRISILKLRSGSVYVTFTITEKVRKLN